MAPTVTRISPVLVRTDVSSGPNRNSEVFAVAAVFLVIAFAGLVARLWSKRIKRRPLQIDDYLLIWAFALSLGETYSFIWAAKYAGLGHHYATLDEAKIISYEKVFYADSLVQPCLLASSKLSVLILLHRVFITRAFQLTAEIMMVIVVGWYIAISFAGAFICIPVSSSWNPELPGHCGDRYLLNVIDPVPWILTDIAILILPLPMVRKLQIPTRQKVALAGIFLLGGLTCVVSCVRYRYAFFSLSDPTWDTVPLLNWNIIEANVTILCASLIASKPVAMLLIPDSLISGLRSFIARSSSSLHIRIGTRNQLATKKDPFESQTHIQRLKSPNGHGTTASQEPAEEIPLDTLKAMNLPQPEKIYSQL